MGCSARMGCSAEETLSVGPPAGLGEVMLRVSWLLLPDVLPPDCITLFLSGSWIFSYLLGT